MSKRIQVGGIGNAIVDVIASIEEALALKDSVGFMIGQPVDSAYRELVFINGRVETVELPQSRTETGLFLKKLSKIARELRQAGLF